MARKTLATKGTGARERLLAATAALLWERSFTAAGVDEICARAGVNKGSFYHFFPSKTDLAVAAIEASWTHTEATFFEPLIGNGSTGLEGLQRLLDHVDRFQRDTMKDGGNYLGCPFGGLGQEMAHQDEKIRRTLASIFDRHVDYIAAALAQGEADGDLAAGDARARARFLLALFEGALLLAKVANDPSLFLKTVGHFPLLRR